MDWIRRIRIGRDLGIGEGFPPHSALLIVINLNAEVLDCYGPEGQVSTQRTRMLVSVVEWFMREPVENFLLVFGGSGLLAGVFHWGSVWADRRRISVRVLSEHYELKSEPNVLVTLRFEVTNFGDKATSLGPTIVVHALSPKAEARRFELQVSDAERQLLPHIPKQFTASVTTGVQYVFCWYKRYRYQVLRGSGAVIRYRNAENKDIGFLNYWRGYIKLRLFHRV